jgi:hypothetical protein
VWPIFPVYDNYDLRIPFHIHTWLARRLGGLEFDTILVQSHEAFPHPRGRSACCFTSLYVMSAAGTKIATCRGGTWGGGLEATTHVAARSVACIRIRTRPLRGGTMNQPSIRKEKQRDPFGPQLIYTLTWICNESVRCNSCFNAGIAECGLSYCVMTVVDKLFAFLLHVYRNNGVDTNMWWRNSLVSGVLKFPFRCYNLPGSCSYMTSALRPILISSVCHDEINKNVLLTKWNID